MPFSRHEIRSYWLLPDDGAILAFDQASLKCDEMRQIVDDAKGLPNWIFNSDPIPGFLSILSIKRGNWFYWADRAERADRAESKESPVFMRI
jgi:hypothetical protein